MPPWPSPESPSRLCTSEGLCLVTEHYKSRLRASADWAGGRHTWSLPDDAPSTPFGIRSRWSSVPIEIAAYRSQGFDDLGNGDRRKGDALQCCLGGERFSVVFGNWLLSKTNKHDVFTLALFGRVLPEPQPESRARCPDECARRRRCVFLRARPSSPP